MNTLKIVKIGGGIINNQKERYRFLKDFSDLPEPKILIHGGGREASALAETMGIPVTMIDGRRVTDTKTLEIITMLYAGKINKNIVAQLQANNTNCIGLSGADANVITAKKRPVTTVDYGFVGDITNVNASFIDLLLKENITPVFCAITYDKNGQLLNTNADTVATEIAKALSKIRKTELYFCFEKQGVLQDITNENSVIENITKKNYQKLLDKKIISDGMLPKLTNCFDAINNGVSKVFIGKPEMVFNKKISRTLIQEK